MAYVGAPGVNCTGCGGRLLSPNNNPEADAIASIVVHELTETATDPYLNAWYQVSGNQYALIYLESFLGPYRII